MERGRPHHRLAQDQRRGLANAVGNAECGINAQSLPFLYSALPQLGFCTQMVRLQKFLADAGVASRRASEKIILAGRVAVNGETVCELGAKVEPTHDHVTPDGQRIRPRKASFAFREPLTL